MTPTFIIMGTHGVSGFEEKIIGSNSNCVVVNAPCRPIITIRQKYSPTLPKKIVLPIDMSKDTRKKKSFCNKIRSNVRIRNSYFMCFRRKFSRY